MKLNNFQKKILKFLGLRLAAFLINVLLLTVKIKFENNGQLKKMKAENKNFILAFWHGSMLAGWFINKGGNCAALVSKSKDGEILSHILEKWNYKLIRGSSSDGGNEALDNMLATLADNYSLAITPDGPTGPIHKMKPGTVIASKKSGVPVIFAGIACGRKYVLNSWDKFEIPKPFSTIGIKFSEPVYIDKDLSYEETSVKITECENLLNNIQAEAQKIV